MKQLLGDKHSGRLESSKEVNHFLQDTLSDPMWEQALDANKALINPTWPTAEFNLREPSLKEVEEVIKAAQSASTPGPIGVHYLVYKHSPELPQHPWKTLKGIW